MTQTLKIQWLVMLFGTFCIKGVSQTTMQVSAGANFVITAGTYVHIDGLVLKPSANYTITGLNSLTRNATATPPPPTTYIGRVYDFLQTLPAYSGDITIYYQDAELNGANEAALNLNVYNGTAWTVYGAPVRDAVNNFVTTTGLSNIALNQLTLADLSVVPVTLSRFDVHNNNCIATLQWSTQTEQNSKLFDVQHSTDAVHYTSIGTVTASGNSASAKYYTYTYPLATPNNYFRLLVVDADGSSKTSPVVNVRSNCHKARIAAFPNPAKTVVTITGLVANHQLKLSDAAGKIISTQIATNTVATINVSALPPGIYYVQVSGNNTIVENLKLVKQ